MVNTLLGKPNQNLNNFKFDLEVNPRIFYGEPQILLMQVHWHLDVIRSFLLKSIQVLNLSSTWNSHFNWIWLVKVLWFVIQILFLILKSFNKESCSLIQKVHNHILFEMFQAWECHLWIESIQVILINFE
jgi:hypothetical protein